MFRLNKKLIHVSQKYAINSIKIKTAKNLFYRLLSLNIKIKMQINDQQQDTPFRINKNNTYRTYELLKTEAEGTA